jgi:RNA polymerase sigma-70 factor (ECF subfamily)
MSDFEAFYRANVKLIHGLAVSRTGNTAQAEDLTQDTFLRAWQHFALVSALKPLQQKAWLTRTLRNLATDEWRRQSPVSAADCQLWEPGPLGVRPGEPPGDGSNAMGLRLDVARALGELDEESRELVLMRYLEEMNSREIGEALGVPEATVRTRLARCRKTLASRLTQWAGDGRQHETG